MSDELQERRMSDDARKVIALDDAIKLLPDGAMVHTFRNPAIGMMLGADWDRDSLIEAMRKAAEIEVTGPTAQAVHHGLAILEGGCYLFIETQPQPEPRDER